MFKNVTTTLLRKENVFRIMYGKGKRFTNQDISTVLVVLCTIS